MPTAKYDVYISNATVITAIEEYTDKHDLSESKFFKQAAIQQLEEERDTLQEQIDKKRKQVRMLMDEMGLTDMMGSSGDGAPGPQQDGSGEPSMDEMDEERMDSLVAEALHAHTEARMDALEAADQLGLEVESDESTDDIKQRVVDTFYDSRDTERMDSARIDARFDVACEELEERAERREDSYEKASERTSNEGEPTDAEAQYHQDVYN